MDAAAVRATVLSLLEISGSTIEQFVEHYRSKLGYDCKLEDIRAFLLSGKHELVISNLLSCWLANKSREEYAANYQSICQQLDKNKPKQPYDGINLILTRKKRNGKNLFTLITVNYHNGVIKSDQISRTEDSADPLAMLVWRLIAFDRTARPGVKVSINNNLLKSTNNRVRSENTSADYYLDGITRYAPMFLEHERWRNMKLDYSEQYGELLLHIEAYPPPRIYFFDGDVANVHKYASPDSKSLFVVFTRPHQSWSQTESNFRMYRYTCEDQYKDHINVKINLVMASLHFDLPLGINFYIVGGKVLYPGDSINDRRIVHILPTSINKLVY